MYIEEYGAIRAELGAFVEKYEGEADVVDAYARMTYDFDGRGPALPMALVKELDYSLKFVREHLPVRSIGEDLLLWEMAPEGWRNSALGAALRAQLDVQRDVYRARAGRVLLDEMGAISARLDRLMVLAEGLRSKIEAKGYELPGREGFTRQLIYAERAVFDIEFWMRPVDHEAYAKTLEDYLE